MCLDRWAHPWTRALHADAAVEIVAEQGDQQDHDQGDQRPVDQELFERKGHDVVADVAVELRIGGVEGRPVLEQDPVLPLADRLRTDDEGEDGDHRHPQPTGVGTDHLLVALDELVLGVERGALGGEPLGHHEAGQQHHGEDDPEGHQQPHLYLEQLDPDRVKRDRAEPQGIGVEDGERAQGGDQDDQDDHAGNDPPAPARTGTRRHREVLRGAHQSSSLGCRTDQKASTPGVCRGSKVPVGNFSPGCCDPLSPLSSQSGQGASPPPATATHSNCPGSAPRRPGYR